MLKSALPGQSGLGKPQLHPFTPSSASSTPPSLFVFSSSPPPFASFPLLYFSYATQCHDSLLLPLPWQRAFCSHVEPIECLQSTSSMCQLPGREARMLIRVTMVSAQSRQLQWQLRSLRSSLPQQVHKYRFWPRLGGRVSANTSLQENCRKSVAKQIWNKLWKFR